MDFFSADFAIDRVLMRLSPLRAARRECKSAARFPKLGTKRTGRLEPTRLAMVCSSAADGFLWAGPFANGRLPSARRKKDAVKSGSSVCRRACQEAAGMVAEADFVAGSARFLSR